MKKVIISLLVLVLFLSVASLGSLRSQGNVVPDSMLAVLRGGTPYCTGVSGDGCEPRSTIEDARYCCNITDGSCARGTNYVTGPCEDPELRCRYPSACVAGKDCMASEGSGSVNCGERDAPGETCWGGTCDTGTKWGCETMDGPDEDCQGEYVYTSLDTDCI